MPQMNRIRVNNVKYNFGTQQYDDFVLRMHGKNTIYDLANGGGKSVLMLLLLQNLIPNCTLDEKQPIEKLFRTSGGSATIHSLVEWNLDACDIEEDYRFMLTGFCARKARDVSEEETASRETAAIDYFNYCIFYRAYNENDLVNLPLISNGERITYNGLKTYLKDLERNAPALKVFVFERKGEYQQFISHYGLYESAWEMIRGINKTEGHVRTYFETNYKTTRKVVEDLLIEEIIEKSFRDKTNQSDLSESMAKTLLDMKDKLMELSEKKNERSQYEHQKELLRVLSGRVQALQERIDAKEMLSRELLSIHAMLKSRVNDEESHLLARKRQIEAKGEECVEKERVIACLKVQEEEDALAQKRQAEESAQIQASNAQIQLEQQDELCRLSENGNDYLEYSRLEAQLRTQQAVIDKAREDSSEYAERLYDYASVKKQFMDERLSDVRTKRDLAKSDVHKCKIELKSMMQAQRELECEKAVAQADTERLKVEAQTREQQLSQDISELGVLVLEELPGREAKVKKQIDKYKSERAVNDAALEVERNRQVELHLTQQKLKLTQNRQDENGAEDTRLHRFLEDGKERVMVLAKTYHVDVSDETQLPYEAVIGTAKEQLEEMMLTRQQTQGRVKDLKSTLQARRQGLLVTDTKLLESLQSYLQERHNLQAKLGQQYVLSLEESVRSELLSRVPYVAYGLVVAGAESAVLTLIRQDVHLRERMTGAIVPLFLEDTLEQLELPLSGQMAFLYGDEQTLCRKDGFAEQIKNLESELAIAEQELSQLQDAVKMLTEDYAFLLEYRRLARLSESEKDASDDAVSFAERLAEQLQEVEEQLQTSTDRVEELSQKQTSLGARQQEAEQEWQRLSTACRWYEEQQAFAHNAAERQEQLEEITTRLADAELAIASKNALLKETRARLEGYEQQIAQSQDQWDTCYAPYYRERKVLDLGYNESQLDSEFEAMRQIVEKGLGSVEDKQNLVDTIRRNMEQLERGMKRRGADWEKLAEQASDGELRTVNEADLALLYRERDRYQRTLEQAQKEYRALQQERSRCEGGIEHGLRELEEQGIRYTRLKLDSADLARARKEQEQVFAQMIKQREEMTQEFIALQKEHSRQVDFYKDVKRVVGMYHLSAAGDVELIDVSRATMEQLHLRQAEFEQAMEQERKARQELERYKEQTAQSLAQLHAYELADVIRRDVVLPETTGELQELLDSLRDMVGFIDLEQERIDQSIQDMELIKNNFESQCIRRCQDVRTELERLPRLSGITLDGEPIQMIDLKIPYIHEEMMQTRMSEYIDRIVREVDEYETYAQRMKYIRNQLSLKRLFSVIVTDMNAIRLHLYKRERIKEQSRYLRYEEAVGSTGQSQGIYIQFLIAIINYIANIHSVNTDNNALGKVIFIDNPFGAAKDIYIWEPIFEMLKTNNVQLIVPARGATPAITGRFDVNYILGQKLVGGKQQTVVVDYRSQVEKTELEFKKIDFEQESFDFI